jgi:uncharacterized protein
MAYLFLMKKNYVLLLMIGVGLNAMAQTDSTQLAGIFERITKEVQAYKIDTSAAPDDKVTRKIRELGALKGGFNISEAIDFKMQEEEKENKTPKATLTFLREQFHNGKGKQWLDNAVVHIYRDHFTYSELKQMVKFYKTSAGQKLATDFPLIMMKTLMAGQVIHDVLVKEVQ